VSPLFFQLLNHRGGADPQHPGRVTHPAAIKTELNHLLFDLGRAALVGGIEQKGLVGAGRIVAAIALFPVSVLPPLITCSL
jgi:hypothetical protein